MPDLPEILHNIAPTAGLAGVAIATTGWLFRNIIAREIFPTLNKSQAYQIIRLIVICAAALGMAGVLAWAWVETRPQGSTVADDLTSSSALERIPGVWGLPASVDSNACVSTLTYSLSHRGPDRYVVVVGANFQSVGRIESVGPTSIFTRTVFPATQAGKQWELKLEGDRLIQVDSENVSTTLVRCQK